MNTEGMIVRLKAKFGNDAIGQVVWLDTERTTDIYEMSAEEVTRLYLRFFPKAKSVIEVMGGLMEEQELKRLRSVILADAQYIGLYVPGNWTAFNRFMLEKSVFKKPLNRYTIGEFPELKRQFKSLRTKYDQRKTQPYTKEWYRHTGFHKPSEN